VSFYQGIFCLHEFAAISQRDNPNESPIPQMDNQDFALYRRILKLCLEQACDIPLVRNVPLPTPRYLKHKEQIIDELLYLGNFLYEFADLLAQQHMIEDCVDLRFTPDGLFYFTYKHHYSFVIDNILKDVNAHLSEAVVGEDGFEEFTAALGRCHGVKYEQIVGTIILMQENNEAQGGKLAMEKWYAYPKNLESLFGIPYQKAKEIFEGLTLTSANKMSLRDAIFKPYHINKYLYRPILVWNVKGVDRAIVGEHSFNEAIMSLYSNAFGWKKFPDEWSNSAFQEYILALAEKNDKILEDAAEEVIKEVDIIYDRNVTSLKKWNNQNLNIHNALCGEIDFLFLIEQTVYICDSKHLISRYDMNNFRNDYAAFETAKKAYNKTMTRKIAYLKANLHLLEEHFQVRYQNKNLRIQCEEVAGIFVINTPTFVMYNNQYRIYTLKDFKAFLKGTFKDTVYQLLITEGDSQTLLRIKYPYFHKPNYLIFGQEADE